MQADSGAIGGNTSHEFMVLAGSGEADLVYCDACDYAANVEKAEAKPDVYAVPDREVMEKGLVYTPGTKTIAALAEFLNISPKETIKSLLYEADGSLVCVLCVEIGR